MRSFVSLVAFLAFSVGLFVAPTPPSDAAFRPPTVDPTYGLPLPAHAKAPAVSAREAQWIWAGTMVEIQTVYLRRTIELTAAPKTAILYLTADNFFTLFVNGKQVDETTSDPSNPNLWQQVHVVDVGSYLQAGKNVLAVRARNAGGSAGFLARLEVPGQSDIETDARWKVSAETASDDWLKTDFQDTLWQAATVIAPSGGDPWADAGGLQGWPDYKKITVPYLAHLMLPVTKVVDIHPGMGEINGADKLAGHADTVLTVTPPPVGTADTPSLLLDFGREVAGCVLITPLTAGAIQVGTGESEGEAINSPWGGLHSLKLVPGDTAATPYSAFRYARIVFPASDAIGPVCLRVTLDHKYYPVQYKGSFSCSDPLLTKIWYTGAYTAHLCMQEDIWDAPKRDRARWAGDLDVSGEVVNTVFADKFLMEQTLTRLYPGGSGYVNGIPGYSCAWVCCLADFYRHIGDAAYLSTQHDPLLSLLATLHQDMDAQGIFGNTHQAWTFVDWSPDFESNSPQSYAATHLFLVKAVRESVFLLHAMGDISNAQKYAAWADALTVAARQHLADPVTGTYGNRLQENAMAIYSGVATPAQRVLIYRRILNPDNAAWNNTGMLLGDKPVLSPYYGNYVIFAMSQAGHTADTLRILRNFWGGMLADGATTFWEAYDPKWPKQDFHAFLQADQSKGYFVSLCHGWSAGPTSWLTERVLGVRPTGRGFQTSEIMPDLAGLTWAEGDVPTPCGIIHIHVNKAADKTVLVLTLPKGVHATVGLPGSVLTVNGLPAKAAWVKSGRIFVALNGGTYHFSARSGNNK